MTKQDIRRGYGFQTIGSLIQSLERLVNENSQIDYDSPIMINDFAMSGIKYKFDVLASFSPLTHSAGVCLFHSLENEVPPVPTYSSNDFEDEIDVEMDSEKPFIDEEKVRIPVRELEREDSFLKFVKAIKS